MVSESPPQSRHPAASSLLQDVAPLLRSSDWESVLRAFHLASAIGTDALTALTDGVFIDDDGRMAWAHSWAQAVPVKGLHREDVALLALSLSPAGPLARLRELDLSDLDVLTRLEPLSGAHSLEVLTLDGCPALRDLSFVGKLPRLRELRASLRGHLAQPPSFPVGNSLTYLSLSDCRAGDLTCLGSLESLQTLVLREWSELRDIDAIASARRLERLSLVQCPMIASLAPIAKLTSLRRLSVKGLRSTLSLDALTGLPHLEELDLSGSQVRVSLDVLRGATRLRSLALSDCPGAVGLDTLLTLEHLDQIALPNLEEDTTFHGSPRNLDLLLVELSDGSGPIAAFHEGAEQVRRVVAAAALLETFRDRARFASWGHAQSVWHHALFVHPGLARNAVGRIMLRQDGTWWWPPGCTIAQLCQRFGAPPWIGQAVLLLSAQLQPSS